MSVEITWQDIALRLFLTVAGGALIGLNREEHAHSAGLRTTLLVCLAASLSMIQVNLLLGIAGKAQNSFVVMDLMRLPLGILSGMGFIGGGAILRKGNLVHGITTAATLWFVTVMGLCFGGGQIGLGLCALALGMIILSGLKQVEKHCKQDRHATLVIAAGQNALPEAEITQTILAAGCKMEVTSVTMGENAALQEMKCDIKWKSRAADTQTFSFLKELSARFGLAKIDLNIEK